ncbi:MAG: hypothetical protein PHU36_01120 [Syntrophomonadaceae bacterium]|nr:hypothetical protein [Syntrophomonadaceae bacterium]
MKRIGMDKKVELEGLEQLAFGLKEHKACTDLKEALDNFLRGKINGKESRRKQLNVLMRIWVSVPTEHEQLRDRALTFLSTTTTRERLALHWGLCLLAFELFRDVASILGKLFNLKDESNLSQVHNRIVESWGDRTTLIYAVQRMLRSMANWGVLQEAEKKGLYKPAKKIRLEDKDLKLWLMECYLTCIEQKAISLQSINEAPALFPFVVDIKLGDLMNSDSYEVNRQGLDVDVVELR